MTLIFIVLFILFMISAAACGVKHKKIPMIVSIACAAGSLCYLLATAILLGGID